MRVGLDFDNTIVSYDALFHRIAVEGGWVGNELPPSKLLVRDHLRKIGKEDVWTEMQGLVYGARMSEAQAFPGVLSFMRWARNEGHDVYIISHKTLHPFIGPKYDLHAAARQWVSETLRDSSGPLIDAENVFLELTKEEKCARIAQLRCAVFLDDLPELLTSPDFPPNVEPLLFDPEGHHVTSPVRRVSSWAALHDLIASRWQLSQ